MAATPEKKVKALLDKTLHQRKVWFYSPQAGPFGRAGIPDRVAIVDGLFLGIECKADRTKKPTRLQTQCMKQIEAAGGRCFLVYDAETIEEVAQFIDAYRKEQARARYEPQEPRAGSCDGSGS
jgi:hypothetical protein